jgi:hypothetical protein
MIQKLFFLSFLFALISKGYCQVNLHKYSPITEQKIKNTELTELLGIIDLVSSKTNNEYECRLFSVFNGPSDPGYEGCNKSCYYYISNGKIDLPEKYYLFKIGPFYEPTRTELIQDDGNNQLKLIIQHIKNETTLISEYLINFRNITKVK